MNRTIANHLKQAIALKHYAHVVAGIVTPVKRTITNSGKSKPQTVTEAVDCGVIGIECPEGDLAVITPDSSKRSIFYFEDNNGVELEKSDGHRRHFRCTLTLVGWLNLNKLGLPSNDGCNGCQWSYRVYNDIMGLFLGGENIGEACKLLNVNMYFVRQLPRSADIFRRYVFAEEYRQFRLPPYDYFAIEILCKWSVSERCVGDVPQNDPIEC